MNEELKNLYIFKANATTWPNLNYDNSIEKLIIDLVLHVTVKHATHEIPSFVLCETYTTKALLFQVSNYHDMVYQAFPYLKGILCVCV